jgi:hypothetical protein
MQSTRRNILLVRLPSLGTRIFGVAKNFDFEVRHALINLPLFLGVILDYFTELVNTFSHFLTNALLHSLELAMVELRLLLKHVSCNLCPQIAEVSLPCASGSSCTAFPTQTSFLLALRNS